MILAHVLSWRVQRQFTSTLCCNRGDLLHILKRYYKSPPTNFRRREKDNIFHASINIILPYHVVTQSSIS
jgi:hypothetical protein